MGKEHGILRTGGWPALTRNFSHVLWLSRSCRFTIYFAFSLDVMSSALILSHPIFLCVRSLLCFYDVLPCVTRF